MQSRKEPVREPEPSYADLSYPQPEYTTNQYITGVPSKVHGGAYVSTYIGHEHIVLEVLEKLDAKVKRLKTNNRRLREELQQTQQELQQTQEELSETCAHVKALYRKIAAA